MTRVRISIDPVTKEINPAAYQERWEEKCDDAGDMEEGAEYPPITDEFVIECLEEDLNDGTEDVSEVFDSAAVEVKPA